MPNHVKNIVKMEGITKLPLFKTEYDEYEKRDVTCFDFNKIIPMPESLNIESGSMTDEAIVYYVTDKCTLPLRAIKEEDKELVDKKVSNRFSNGSWAEEVFMRVLERTHDMPAGEKEEFFKKGQTYVSNIRNYGHATWYDWCIENWGTKWNAYSNEQEDEDTISFETAWSNPEPVMLKLSEMYPDATLNTGELTRIWAAMTATGFTGKARSLTAIIAIPAVMRHTRSTSSAGEKASVCIRMKMDSGNTVIVVPAMGAIRR